MRTSYNALCMSSRWCPSPLSISSLPQDWWLIRLRWYITIVYIWLNTGSAPELSGSCMCPLTSIKGWWGHSACRPLSVPPLTCWKLLRTPHPHPRTHYDKSISPWMWWRRALFAACFSNTRKLSSFLNIRSGQVSSQVSKGFDRQCGGWGQIGK